MSTPWECCVCYSDGARTGRVTLTKCNHTICLVCCSEIIATAPHNKKDHIKCPMCRVVVPAVSAPSRWSEAHMRIWAEWIQESRQAIKKVERMLTETNDERELRLLNKQLESMTRTLPQYIATLKEQADDWGQWEKYEAMTHPPLPRAAAHQTL